MAQTPKLFLIACITIASLLVIPYATADDSRELKVDEQPLSDALKIIANEFGVDIAFFPEATDGLDSIALAGSYTSGEAFDALLEDTELEYQALDNGTVVVRAKNQGGTSDSKNSSPAPILMAQNTTSQSQTSTSGRSDPSGTSVVTGRVTDAQTGANLKGAKITIEETGQWTRSEELGRYRFASVPAGNVTLTVSFLGYAGQSVSVGVRGDSVSQDFQLRGGSELEEIIVIGQRSARTIALNLERTADNSSTVISSDQLGAFTGTTVSDALRIAPGVAFEVNEQTGEGENIIFRGLEPRFNQVTLNGVRLTNDVGSGRVSNLSNVLTESIESVTINRSLLPSHDGTGTGALIEIETKSPLDRKARFARFSVEGVRRGEDFGHDRLYSGTLSGRFGANEDFGISLSAQYRDLDIRRGSYRSTFLFGEYLPEGISSERQIDPITSFPFEPENDLAYPGSVFAESGVRNSENLSVTATVEKQVGNHTNLRFDYTRSEVSATDFNRTLNIDPLDGYQLLPVDDLGGELRYALVTERPADGPFPGVLASVSQSLFYSPVGESDTDTFSFRGTSRYKSVDFKYSTGYSSFSGESEVFDFGISNTRDLLTTALSADELDPALLNNLVDGRIVSVFDPVAPASDPGFVFPRFTESYFARINNIDSYQLSGTLPTSSFIRDIRAVTENERVSLSSSARFNSDSSWLDYVEVGGFFEDYSFSSGPDERGDSLYFIPSGIALSDVGLDLGEGILGNIGLPASSYGFVTLGSAVALRNNLPNLVEDGRIAQNFFETSEARLNEETVETEFAGYLEAGASWRDFELIGGLRFVRVDVTSTLVSRPSITLISGPVLGIGDVSVEAKGSQTDLLPRLLMNYRPSEDVVMRGAYYTTVARPSIIALNAPQSVSYNENPIFGPNSDQPYLRVSSPNPDLKASLTHNFDLSAEWYTSDVGALKTSVFYKEVKDPFSRNESVGGLEVAPNDLDLPDIPELRDLPGNVFVELSTIENGDDPIELWGAELSVERRFDKLPGWASGLGVYANVGYADSSQVARLDTDSNEQGFVEFRTELPGSPRYTATGAITYSKYGIDSSLTYTWQDRRLLNIQDFGLDQYRAELEQLDFRLVYNGTAFDRRYSIFFEGRDLLRDGDDPFTSVEAGGERGTPVYRGLRGTFFGGRSFALGASLNF